MLSEEEALRLFYVMEIGVLFTNWLSILAASFVVLVITGAMVVDKKSMNRVSIRITLAISVLDILKSILTLRFFQASDTSEMGCVFVEAMENFVTLAYFFLNVSIAVNLHLIFLNGFGFNPLWERGYWVGSFGLAMLLSAVVPVGYLVGVQVSSSCLQSAPLALHLWQWSFLYIWVLAAVAYCSAVVGMVIVKLIRNERNLSMALGSGQAKGNSWQSTRYSTVIRSLICRITFYCTIPVMTHVFVVISEVDHVIHGSPKLLLRVIRLITMGLPGFLNCLAFIADPAFRQACEAFKVYFRNLPFVWPLEIFRDHIVPQPRFPGTDPTLTSFQDNDEPTTTHRDSITSEQHILATADATKPPSLQSAVTEEQQFNDYIKSL